MGSGKGALSVEEHIAGKDDSAILIDQLDGSGPGHVTCRVNDDFDLLLTLPVDLAAFKALDGQLLCQLSDIAMEEKRVFGDAVLFALAFHDIDRITQHAWRERDIGRGGDDGGLRIVGSDDGERAKVVEVAMREDDEVEVDIFDRSEVGEGVIAKFFRIKSGID